MNVYIARKRSKGGKRFGFVRMNSKEDADRVIGRLHGFKLYGSLLKVKHARNTHEHWGRFAGWNKEKGEETSCKEWGKYVNQHMKEDGTTREPDGSSNLIEVRQERLTGHVEDEDLWKIRKCLVGEMTTIYSVSSISNRILKWGLGEIKVQRMGEKLFLLTIGDEDLYLMLEDLDWSYLKEIFSDIKPWSETLSYRERETWLEVSGLPLHCWNGTTLKKISVLWGNFEAMGVNANHSRDCEKMTILISTKQVKKIEEVIEMEVGDKIFEVGVIELGFSDDSDTTVGKKFALNLIDGCDPVGSL
ncbi:hypothetical protein V6N13_101240 [Hibiscus sabdariffa]